jgi:hypothetical protein
MGKEAEVLVDEVWIAEGVVNIELLMQIRDASF